MFHIRQNVANANVMDEALVIVVKIKWLLYQWYPSVDNLPFSVHVIVLSMIQLMCCYAAEADITF